MKARLSMFIGVAASFILSASFAYGQQTDSSMFIPAAFVPGTPQMGADNDPAIRILHYRGIREKAEFAVGESLNIAIENSTGTKIWYIRRRPPGVDAGLLATESISIQRLVNNKWRPVPDQYQKVMDDPDGEFAPVRHRIDPNVTVIRKWTPKEAGQYRVFFVYYTTPNGNESINEIYSKSFRVHSK